MAISGASFLHHGISTNYTRVVGGNVVFARDHIWLNGHKVKIGGSLSDTARALNRHSSKTGVRAVVVNAGKPNERLKLIVITGKLTISDPKGVLSGLYKGKKIGTGDDMLIQIAASNKSKVNFLYNASTPEKNLVQNHVRLSEGSAKPLVAKKLLPHPLQVHIEAQEDVVEEVIEQREEVDNPLVEEPEDPTIRQEYLRRSKQKIKEEIDRSNRENSAIFAQDVVNEVIRSKNLKNTDVEQTELTKDTISEEIYASGLGEDFLRRNYEIVANRVAKQVSDNRDKMSSAFSDKLVISESKIRSSVRSVLQQIKLEQYESMAKGIIKDLGRLTIAKSDYIKISGAIRDGLFGGRELTFSEIYLSYTKLKDRMSELVTYCASKEHLSRGELHLTSSRLVMLKDGALNLRGTDLGLV